MSGKDLLGIVATFLTFGAFASYLRSIVRGRTKPHVFSWIIWGATTFIVFLAQTSAGGGAGAWPIGVSGLITLYIAGLAYSKKSDCTITRADWVFLGLAAISLPLWYFTADAVWTVILLTLLDLLGFGPTVRKSYHQPRSEPMTFVALIAVRNFISVAALENHSLTTVLFPGAVGLACVLFIGMVFWRRNQLG